MATQLESVWSELCGMWTPSTLSHALLNFKFDLNYVGCERCKAMLLLSLWDRFDLNYVGCELREMWKCTRVNRRLIWTMWDVNVYGTLLSSWVAVFDLNYVGCEHIRATIISFWRRVWSELCGMWTEKSISAKSEYILVWSELCGMWTLTKRRSSRRQVRVWSELCGMWTVFEEKLFIFAPLFDLNYVGCEPFSLSSKPKARGSLIWTMWDVNSVVKIGRFEADTRLIWTMWDVNIGISTIGILKYFVWSELCGMWTKSVAAGQGWRWFGLIWTMWDVNRKTQTRTVLLKRCLIWTMWDVNQDDEKHRVDTKLQVWSELCGMWTSQGRGLWHYLWSRFDLNYVGCELNGATGRYCAVRIVWSELCGMWTRNSTVFIILYISVWSELCGMWTERCLKLCSSRFLVWSELCGMWTRELFRWVSSEDICLIWTMWDVNKVRNEAFDCNFFSLIWTMWDVNKYVGCT